MGEKSWEPTLLELVPAPIFDFDGIGKIVIVNCKMFWPLYRLVPSLTSDEVEPHLVAWTSTKLENVPFLQHQTSQAVLLAQRTIKRLVC